MIIIKINRFSVYIHPPTTPQVLTNDDEGSCEAPPCKKHKKNEEEPQAGPSGLNNKLSESSEKQDEPQLDEKLPPAPYVPVLANNEHVQQHEHFGIRDLPIFRIVNRVNVGGRAENMVPLRRLSLRGYKNITDTALTYIKHLDLELLDLTYTSVSVNGINNFLVDHPVCRVVHEEFCSCPPNLHF